MKKVHLGSGTNVIKGWENLDIESRPGAVQHDLTKGLPYADKSVDLILSEHVIEHFDKQGGYQLLEESFRVLKIGGGLRIGWPDLNKLIKAYVLRQRRYKNYVTPHFEVHLFNTWDEMLSDCLFGWEHRYAYTKKHLISVLDRIGFRQISEQLYMHSKYGILHDVRNDPATTYLEATRE